ncbi:MAG: hypothetical protein HYS13_24365 [Planctomycetia bacterium]|nr:hypothetical protein [Planctomycetia bacterium]
MPLSELLVEGNLDAQVLGAVFAGRPPVRIGGDKRSLKGRARDQRERARVDVGYVRDRDFDYDPPKDVTQPTVDWLDNKAAMGWRWCRHEIENYLVDPSLVSKAMGWPVQEFSDQLVAAAKQIRYYEIARWTVGVARRALPPNYELETRPPEIGKSEFRLPDELTEAAMFDWAQRHIHSFADRVNKALGKDSIENSLKRLANLLTDAFLGDVANALLWCSGKDLLTALSVWLRSQGIPSAGDFRARVRDWLIQNPEDAVASLPEWQRFREVVRS